MDPYELNDPRFSPEMEFTDDMFTVIMEESAKEANTKSEKTKEEYFGNLLQKADSLPSKGNFFNPIWSASPKPLLTIIAGPNGSGKTTITSPLLDQIWNGRSQYINPDIEAKRYIRSYTSKEFLHLAQYCQGWREGCIVAKANLIMETVLSGEDKVEFVEYAIKQGYYIRLFFIATSDPSINASRVARSVMEGGLDVPISKIISRYPKSILNCKRLSNIVDQLYVIDNSIDGEPPRALFFKSKGKLREKYVDEVPLWAQAIL